MLTTNDRVIKLWKMEYRVQRQTSKCSTKNGRLALPQSEVVGEGYEGVEKM
jgi:hypothetical protein